MSRMPAHVLYSFRYAFRALVFIAAVATFSCFSPIAHADPHAVFYTDRAQEQVFFNTLAALNQADFVEPGIPGQPYSRADLAGLRAATIPQVSPNVPFVAETNPLITSTHTNLPAIVSRSITLEGNDLWTAYLVNQFALETSQRRSESRLARILCQQAFGDPGCNLTPGNNQEEHTAFVTNPLNVGKEIKNVGDAILLSGDPTEATLRNSILNTADSNTINQNPDLYNQIRPKSNLLANLRENIVSTKNATDLVNGLTSEISGIASGPDPETFKGISFDSNGDPKMSDTNATVDDGIHKLVQLANLPSDLWLTKSKGEEIARLDQYYSQNPTAKADSVLESDGSGALVRRITTPAASKLDAENLIFQLAALAASNQKYANPATIATPGKTSLVDPTSNTKQPVQQPQIPTKPQGQGTIPQQNNSGTIDPNAPQNQQPTPQELLNQGKLGLNGSGQTPQVAGISTTFDPQEAQAFQQAYENPVPYSLSPTVNGRDPIEEPGLLQALDRATNQSSNAFGFASTESSAFDINVASILSGSALGDILCSISPSIDACLNNTV